MKSYKNKKFYNYKTVHKRKKRSIERSHFWDKLGKEYTKQERRNYRVKSKVILIKKLKGYETEFSIYKKTMSWDT
ncbi:hypothetical protein [uncultured Psychroserpens sp.]|uniref:hypothetical protein n=1 Tax=uncultured Psychroserpens sp. TaxID=255436 RepID=UPI00263380F0|nr:hypothetical protein [uncultured Psychroserpens sp.]